MSNNSSTVLPVHVITMKTDRTVEKIPIGPQRSVKMLLHGRYGVCSGKNRREREREREEERNYYNIITCTTPTLTTKRRLKAYFVL